MKIRLYHPRDQPQLIHMIELNTPQFFAPSEKKEFIEYLDQDSENYFIIEEENTIIGSGGFNLGFDDGKTARISWGMIHPDWQGKGVGAKITRYRVAQIKKNQEVSKIVVRTTQVVYGFYQKLGFELEHVETDYWAVGFDLYQMKIDLT